MAGLRYQVRVREKILTIVRSRQVVSVEEVITSAGEDDIDSNEVITAIKQLVGGGLVYMPNPGSIEFVDL